MGCPGCLLSEREKQELRVKTEKIAKRRAIQEQKTMVLYELADGKTAFMEFEAARLNGIRPTGFVSHFEPVADGELH